MQYQPDRINTRWRDGLAEHIVCMEHFLERVPCHRLEAEPLVFLAGMLARQLDKSYRRQIRPFIKSNPEDVFCSVRQHDPYLGQNAPVVFLSRANAEFLLVQGASARRRGYNMEIPAQLSESFFGIASKYSYKSGNFVLGDICAFMQNRLAGVQDWLGAYLEHRRKHTRIPPRTSAGVWQRFGMDRNQRNDFKERWEARGIDPVRLNRIARAEFQKMINFESRN